MVALSSIAKGLGLGLVDPLNRGYDLLGAGLELFVYKQNLSVVLLLLYLRCALVLLLLDVLLVLPIAFLSLFVCPIDLIPFFLILSRFL